MQKIARLLLAYRLWPIRTGSFSTPIILYEALYKEGLGRCTSRAVGLGLRKHVQNPNPQPQGKLR